MLQPVKLEFWQRAWIVHEVAHLDSIHSGSRVHRPSRLHSTHLLSRSIVMPMTTSQAAHSAAQVVSM